MLQITQIHFAPEGGNLNEEWFVLENQGKEAVSLRGCQIGWSRPGARKYQVVAKLEPGFTLDVGAKSRVVSGNPRSKTAGQAPADGTPNYFLFLKKPYLVRFGGTIRVLKGQMTMARKAADSSQESGVPQAVEEEPDT